MKVYIAPGSVMGNPNNNVSPYYPLSLIVRRAHKIVDRPEDADLIVAEWSNEARGLLEKYPSTDLLIVLWGDRLWDADKFYARDLQKQFPDRVFIRATAMEPGEESVIEFLDRYRKN